MTVTGSGAAGAPTATNATPLDAAALRNLQTYNAGGLVRIQTRAEKWIPGLVALTGILTTAVVIKGADSFTNLATSWKLFNILFPPADVIIGLMLAGGIAIGLGIGWAYSAAYGDPMDADGLQGYADGQELAGAWAAWTGAVAKAATKARSRLKMATVATVIGTALLAVAVLVTWTAPTQDAATTVTCFSSGGTVVKVKGDLPTIKSGQLTVVPCN